MGGKSVAFPIGVCFRAACNHPFVMVMLFFLAVVYRSFPYVFSLLVSAFPIIFCTGVLLGALLSFSQQKAPEIRGGEDEIIDRAAVHFKTEISNDVSVVERDDSYSVQRQGVEKETSKGCSVVGSIEEDSSEDDDDTGFTERSQEGFELLNKEHGDGLLLKKDHCLPIPKLSSENFEVGIDKSIVGSCDSKLVNIGSPAKHKDDDDEILDSGSDQAGSSSPDAASVAEIVPMLDDELHPLLDEDAPPRPPVNLSQHGSDDVTSEHFSRSNDSNAESDDSIEEKTELQVEDEEDEEEEIQGDKEELTKNAIKWTEEDEKNMMDVGSSELERNQLLERVMARRKSRRWGSMIMMGGKELMNLESSGPPIVTTRQNPFDSLPDSNEEGLPPIPGSAPSILIPRRNPFDIPYYSNEEEKTNHLSGENNSGLDFLDFQPKETTTLFEGSEFINVGPSIFGLSKQDKRDVSCESYFAAEQMAPEGTSYSTTVVYTQSNGCGNSKLSSGPETESMSDGEDLEDKNVIKEDKEEEEEEEEKVDVGDREEKKLIDDEHMFEEAVLISKIEHASEDVGHGSQSSEEEECLESIMGMGSGLKNILVDEIVMKRENLHFEFKSELESVEQSYSNASSSPASSEVNERMCVEKEEKAGGGGGASVEERRSSSSSSSSSSCGCGAENGISRQAAVELSMSASTLVEEEGGERRQPVYDSSPPHHPPTHQSLRKNFSSSSLDVHESWFPPIQVKRTVSFAERVIMLPSSSNQDTEMSIPIIKEMLGSSTISQSKTRQVVPNHQHKVSNSFPDTTTSNSHTQGDVKHLQDHQLLPEADIRHSLNQTDDDDDESTSKHSSSSSSSADQEAQDR